MDQQNTTLSEDVIQRLDNIDWEALKSRFGISRDSVMKNTTVARQLAYGQYTDLVPGSTEEISGMFSLRAYPQGDGAPWKVKAYTMEKPKTLEDDLYIYGNRITSDAVRKSLLEKTDWIGSDGNRKYGYANANAGVPIQLEIDGRRQQYLVSIHTQTNRIVGMPVEHVKALFFDQDGNSRGRSVYGVRLTDTQAQSLAEGRAVRVDGCTTKEGEKFSCVVQFDAAQRQVAPAHPSWIKEAQKAGVDLGLGPKAKEETQKAAKKQEDMPAEIVEQKTTTRRSRKA